MTKEEMQDLDDIDKRYKKLLEYLSKKQYDDSLDEKERFNVFLNFYNQNQLNKYTKYMYYVTLLLVAVTSLQLMKDLQGREATLSLITQLFQLGIVVLLIFVGFSILGGIFQSIKKDWLEIIVKETRVLRKIFVAIRVLFIILLISYSLFFWKDIL